MGLSYAQKCGNIIGDMQRGKETRSCLFCKVVVLCMHIEIPKLPAIEVIIDQIMQNVIIKNIQIKMSEAREKKSQTCFPLFSDHVSRK